MKRSSSEAGTINILLIPLILITLFFIGSIGAAVWAFGQSQHYKNDSDAIASAAADKAIQAEDAKQAAQYAEAAKKPLSTYKGPASYGSVVLQYPKTWSGYVDETVGSYDLDGYFDPGVVPDLTGVNSAFALRIQIINQSYSNTLQQFSGQVQAGKATVTAYSLPKVPSVVGTRIDGLIDATKTGSVVLLPLRDKTLKIWTDSSDYISDFNNNILPNFSFAP